MESLSRGNFKEEGSLNSECRTQNAECEAKKREGRNEHKSQCVAGECERDTKDWRGGSSRLVLRSDASERRRRGAGPKQRRAGGLGGGGDYAAARDCARRTGRTGDTGNEGFGPALFAGVVFEGCEGNWFYPGFVRCRGPAA